MLLVAALVATAAWSYGFAQIHPVQRPISTTKFQKSARMTCEIQTSGEQFDGIVIHWYQQKEGKAPERLLYVSEGKVSVESGFLASRYTVGKVPSQKQFILTINRVIPDDAATYYCAYWDSQYADVKIFGSGTKLIVSSKGSSPPANSEILQKEHENQITYVCLVEKFYPEVIRVTWTDEKNEEVTDNVVKGDTWMATKSDEYSIGSWLTVPVENKDKNYYCKYEHESQERSLPTQETQDPTNIAPQEEDCSTSGNSTVFNRDHIIHRTAYLVYILLLLKSSMYYVIVVVFIYRMWAASKHQGKKA
ncbi:TCR gamma alternate reading frame protein [Strigops habroptila]|uniref:TCR gamma alternate reading frame protein n=1 Tax=Strigops habroptila TaxID=2489341 RepID=UPI0011CFC0DA|nr:TCR gamma alternate reading frame protein [Strigops habroptila]